MFLSKKQTPQLRGQVGFTLGLHAEGPTVVLLLLYRGRPPSGVTINEIAASSSALAVH